MQEENTSEGGTDGTNRDDCIRAAFELKNIPLDALDIMLSSLSHSTKKHYKVSIEKWIEFCKTRGIDPYQAMPYETIEFLTLRFKQGCSYSTLNSDRSAIALISHNNLGTDKMVCRFIKGCFRLRPSLPKYSSTWDIEKMFKYIETMEDSERLSLKLLSYKTVVLLALTSAQRSQYLAKIKIEGIKIGDNEMTIQINELLKTSRPGVENPVIKLDKFDERPKLCVFSTIKEYIDRTKSIRNKEPYLFISFRKPYKVVGTQSLARWVKEMMQKAGIDIHMFTAHSTRHAATSAVFSKGLSIDIIKKRVGWSEKSKVFAKHYNRPIQKDRNDLVSVILSNKKLS